VPRTRYIRYGLLTIVLALVVYSALGWGTRSFEDYCPFGGVESLWGLIKAGEFSCALGPLNLSLGIALIVLTLLSKKSFCGWACPIGFLGELCGHAGTKTFKRKLLPPKRVDMVLKLLRYVVLVVFLVLTYRTGELILRGYDPYYLIFSGFGHGTVGLVSYITLGVLLVAALVVPMSFCRYLCPLGAVFDPFSRVGVMKITRDDAACTACGDCQTACPHNLPVPELGAVRSRDCTNCLECIDACPEKNVLRLQASL